MSDILHLAGPVLLGPDQVHEQAWVVGGRITYDKPTGSGHQVTTLRGWFLPGLVDAHCHIGLDQHGAVDPAISERQALIDRRAGTLLIRDAGSPSDTRWLDDRDDLPKVIRAGRHIARTRRYIRGFAHEIEPEQLADQVRIEAAAGDGWVKIVGDWIDRGSGDLAPCWPAEVLPDAITAAHELGARVTAHCFGAQSLRDFAAAGVDCIEHATGLESDTIETFAAQGITVVPTLTNIAIFPQLAEPGREKFPDFHRTMLDLHARRYQTIAAAHDAGIAIRLGTDAGGNIAHGLAGHEALELAKTGMTATEVLGAGVWDARSWLGHPCLEEGTDADLVVLDADPRRHLEALTAPTAVVLRGIPI